MIEAIIAELRVTAPHRLSEIEALSTHDAKSRTLRNVRVQTLVQFSANVMSVLERRGIAVLHVARTEKSLIIGSRPVVKLTAPGRTDLEDPAIEMWLPVASDVAIGVGRGDGGVSLHHLTDERPIRQLNMAIAKQSRTIAVRSATLVRSIATAR